MSVLGIDATVAGAVADPDVRRVAIVIVTYNSADVIGDCLTSLPPASGHRLLLDVVVVDNASTDRTAAVVADVRPDARFVALDDNRGYAAAINAGVAIADAGDTVLVLNPDVRLRPGAVEALAAALGDGVGITVPKLLDEHGGRQPSLRREPTVGRAAADALLGGARSSRLGSLGEIITDDRAYARPVSVSWASGAVMMIDRPCLDDIGAFDESFFLYSEETDFMLRAHDAGYDVRYLPDAVATHVGGELGTAPDLWARRTINRIRLHRRRHGRVSTAAMLLVSLLGEGLRAAAGRATSRAAVRVLATQGPRLVLGSPPAIEPALPGWICFSAQDWWYHNRAHSDFQLMRRIGSRRPTLLINSIGLRMPRPGRSTNSLGRIGRKARSVARFVRRPLPEAPGLRVVTPLAIPAYGSPVLRRLNARSVRWQVGLAARAAGVVGPGRPDPVIMVTIPTAIDVVEQMPHAALVVNRSDKHSSFPEADRATIEALEERCLLAADRVYYSARSLRADESPFSGDRAAELDHGVDADHFRADRTDLPTDLAAIPGPRIGFFGGLHDYQVDLALLERLARELPDASLVLVGPASCSLERLTRLPNVHHLGPRPYEEIPRYGSGFDVALMPWLANTWIRHANPIKMKEYLALGLPVVSTDFPEVHRYQHLIRVATDADGYISAVRQTLTDGGLGSPSSRRAAVEHATWNAAASKLLRDAETIPHRRNARKHP